MNKLLPSNKIYISESKIAKGERGVFAQVYIKKGEIIETCPIVKFSENESSRFDESEIVNYIYYLGNNKDQLTILLGFGSIYNHSYKPNAMYNEKKMEMDFIASKNIKMDEEISVNYLQESKKTKNPLWFEL